MDTLAELKRGREHYAHHAWLDAFEALSHASLDEPLSADDLELLARSAYMLGRDADYVGGLEQAHQAHLESGETRHAVRCAFWIGHNMLFRGEAAGASGWFARAQRLLERDEEDCVERGYLLIPVWLEQMGAGDFDAGYESAAKAAEIGERFGDADLLWLAVDEQGRALVMQGRIEEGLRLVDEVMVAAKGGELSPIVTGIVYCNTIAFCQNVYELRHAREWTEALSLWCERQPEMVAHNGLCLVHRAEVMQLHGAWGDALQEAERAAKRFTQGVLNELARGKALYQQAEVRRLRGEFEAAENTYREASRCGCEPQPGLALLRLGQGNHEAAAAAIRRAVGEAIQPLKRVRLLPAYVEIMLTVEEFERARAAGRELDEIAASQGSDALRAMSAHAQGALALAEGDASNALVPLRRSLNIWQELEAPYECARVRVSVAGACATLGDEDSAALELEAAREIFERIGAASDLARLDSLATGTTVLEHHGLTARELEVLRLVAAGKTNREIAATLVISEHTVARHLQNVYAKLGVSSRTAASAFAFRQHLV